MTWMTTTARQRAAPNTRAGSVLAMSGTLRRDRDSVMSGVRRFVLMPPPSPVTLGAACAGPGKLTGIHGVLSPADWPSLRPMTAEGLEPIQYRRPAVYGECAFVRGRARDSPTSPS